MWTIDLILLAGEGAGFIGAQVLRCSASGPADSMTKARTQEARRLSDRHQRTKHLKTRAPKNLSAQEPEHPGTQDENLSNLAERTFAWLGGAVFVGSLAACVLVYTVRWSTPAHP